MWWGRHSLTCDEEGTAWHVMRKAQPDMWWGSHSLTCDEEATAVPSSSHCQAVPSMWNCTEKSILRKQINDSKHLQYVVEWKYSVYLKMPCKFSQGTLVNIVTAWHVMRKAQPDMWWGRHSLTCDEEGTAWHVMRKPQPDMWWGSHSLTCDEEGTAWQCDEKSKKNISTI
jgi:hypothetical protein